MREDAKDNRPQRNVDLVEAVADININIQCSPYLLLESKNRE